MSTSSRTVATPRPCQSSFTVTARSAASGTSCVAHDAGQRDGVVDVGRGLDAQHERDVVDAVDVVDEVLQHRVAQVHDRREEPAPARLRRERLELGDERRPVRAQQRHARRRPCRRGSRTCSIIALLPGRCRRIQAGGTQQDPAATSGDRVRWPGDEAVSVQRDEAASRSEEGLSSRGSAAPAQAFFVSQKISAISSILASSSSALAASSSPLVPLAPASLVASLTSVCSWGYFSKCGGLK